MEQLSDMPYYEMIANEMRSPTVLAVAATARSDEWISRLS
jgi:hypothetical protein